MDDEHGLMMRADQDHWNEWVSEIEGHQSCIHLSAHKIQLEQKQYFHIQITVFRIQIQRSLTQIDMATQITRDKEAEKIGKKDEEEWARRIMIKKNDEERDREA